MDAWRNLSKIEVCSAGAMPTPVSATHRVSVPFSAATLIAISGFAALAGFLFLNAIYLQSVRGYSPLHAGLLTLPMAAMMALLPPLSGRIVAGRGARIPLLIAGISVTASGLVLIGIGPDTSLTQVILAYVLFGIGFGMMNAPITNTAVSGMPTSQAGVAAAVASTSRQVGSALGVAVLGTLATSRVVGPLADGFADASRPAWIVISACGLLVLVLGFVSTTNWARATARRTAENFVDKPTVTQTSAVAS